MNKSCAILFAAMLGTLLSASVYAYQLDGLMTVEPKVMGFAPILDENGDPVINSITGETELTSSPVYISGSYFGLGDNNPDAGISIEGGTDGGIILGTHQNFVLNPDEPHPEGHPNTPSGAGSGYDSTPTQESSAMKPFQFFGSSTYIGLNPVSYQSGESHPVPSLHVDAAGNLTGEFSAWEVMWNGSAFEQGPRPDNTGPFVLATGTYDAATGRYVLKWTSQVKGGAFNNVSGFWTLEGEVIPSSLNATALAEPQTLNVRSHGNGLTVTIAVEDVDGGLVAAANIDEGVSITSVGGVEIPAGEITENVEDRVVNEAGELMVEFNDPATGSRQDVIAAVGNAADGSSVDVCVSGMATDLNGIKRSFAACSAITILNRGGR